MSNATSVYSHVTEKRIEKQAEATESRWLSVWEAWGLEVVTEWQSLDPEARQHYEAFLALLEQEWVAISTAEEEAAFLASGAALCERCGLPSELWAWFWRDNYGRVLRLDLSAWPRNVPPPPEPMEGIVPAVVALVAMVAAG